MGGGAAPGASWSRLLPSLRRVPQLARTRIPAEVRRAAPEPGAPGCNRLCQAEAGGGGTVTTGVEGEARAPRAPRRPRQRRRRVAKLLRERAAPGPEAAGASRARHLCSRCQGAGADPGTGENPRRDPEAKPRDETRRLTLALLQGKESCARGPKGRCSQVRVTLLSDSHHAFTRARLPKPGPRLTACLAMAAPAVSTSFFLFLFQEHFGSS